MTASRSRRGPLAALAFFGAAAFLVGCGGGGGAESGTASLAFHVHWERTRALGAEGDPPFGSEMPTDVSRVRVILRSGAFSCCIKFDPRDGAFDGKRRIVLTDLPEGPVDVEVAGFAHDVAPRTTLVTVDEFTTLDTVEDTCVVKQPGGIGEPCDATACGEPSFSPTAHVHADLRAGTEAIAEPTIALARPFLVTSTPPCDGDVPQVFGDTDDVIDVLDRIHVNIGMVVAQPAVGAASGACSCVQGSLICEGREFEFGDVNVIQFAGDGNGNCSELDDGVNLSRPGGVLRCCHDAPGCADRNDCCRPLPLPSGPFDPLVGVKINTAILNLHSGCAAMEVPVNVFPGAAGTVRTSFLVGPPPTTPTPTPTVVPSVATPTGSGPTPIGVPTFVNG